MGGAPDGGYRMPLSRFPIKLNFTIRYKCLGGIVRIDVSPHVPVEGWPDKFPLELAGCAPDTHPFGCEVFFRHPKPVPTVDRKAAGPQHAVGVPGPDPRASAALADPAQEFAVRRVNLHAHLPRPVGDIDVTLPVSSEGHRSLQVGNQGFRLACLRLNNHHLLATDGQQTSLRINGQADGGGNTDLAFCFALLGINDQNPVLQVR